MTERPICFYYTSLKRKSKKIKSAKFSFKKPKMKIGKYLQKPDSRSIANLEKSTKNY